jgi:hypothetical protein
VSQFSILIYIGQAATLSLFVFWKHPETLTELYRLPQSIFFWMGSLDSGSSTIGGIAGAFCPGEVQTILNQMVIPLTMISSYVFLGTTFETSQLWGSGLILIGALAASSDYLFNSSSPSSSDNTATSGHGISLSVSIALYFLSVIPSALSNIYKESKMKEMDLNEFHTSTIVSFWQLWVGFVFLPLMSLPSLGGLSYAEMGSQLSDGYACFLGTDPNDPTHDCSNAAPLFIAYVFVNFFYNILLLFITKRGSAVLLVISQVSSPTPPTTLALLSLSSFASSPCPLLMSSPVSSSIGSVSAIDQHRLHPQSAHGSQRRAIHNYGSHRSRLCYHWFPNLQWLRIRQ